MSYNEKIEVGGNVFELIEFTLDRYLPNGKVTTGRYGVNVAKVREVVRMPAINPLASSLPGVAGLFELRGIPIPAINLAVALGDQTAPIKEDQQIIVTEFSMKRAGFIVKSTHRIRRIAWEKVLPPATDKHASINGMTLIENNEFLFILDLEKIILDIEKASGYYNVGLSMNQSQNQESQVRENQVQESANVQASLSAAQAPKVLLVDDSDIILNNASMTLRKAGFLVLTATDGLKAKEWLERVEKEGKRGVDVIVTDVEMPRMDGLSLTKWIKAHPTFQQIPVILHTSLSGRANQEAGKQVGANGYVVKNDFPSLIKMINGIRE